MKRERPSNRVAIMENVKIIILNLFSFTLIFEKLIWFSWINLKLFDWILTISQNHLFFSSKLSSDDNFSLFISKRNKINEKKLFTN